MDGGKAYYLCRVSNYSNSRVLGYGRLESCTRPCAKVDNNLTKFKKIYHYTKGVGMKVVNDDQEGLWSVNHESVVVTILRF